MNREERLARQSRIRNFSIIAHIDHGKSTLADRILEKTSALTQREMKDQMLDAMDLERERGITIKLNAVQLVYKANDGNEYIFHLIDTPGHVDFSYEVSRSLAACEGALLIVDAAQGIEAQTLANVYLALDNDLEILPVINKIDLPSAEPERVRQEVEDVIGLDASEAVLASAKNGIGIEEILEQIVEKVPAPSGDPEGPLKALIFDSLYDSYRGVVAYIRIVEGSVKPGQKIKMMATGKEFEVTEVGVFTPKPEKREELTVGDVGFLTASIKNVGDTRVGDTITSANNPADEPLPGYRRMNPMVYCGLYPVDTNDYNDLREALERLELNDASLQYEPETSQALGFGFRCGFLGLLHMEIIQERIEREFGIDLITTAPSVVYSVQLTNGEVQQIDNPSNMPDRQKIEEVEEPYVKATIMVPNDFVGAVMELCQGKRGIFIDMQYLDENRVQIIYEIPLSEIVYDFFDQLKSNTKGYASFDYELIGYKPSNLVKMDILLNGEVVDALSVIVHRDSAYERGKQIVEKLKELIPRQQFEVPVQASIGTKIIARSTIKAMRKNVLAKCYGGDISRKRKLLEKQKEGKKRMKAVGNVEVPQEAFMAVLRMDEPKK
ncbi:translation elongation factor 4 [Halalkalibacterium halodurans]|jgi:GTP-binding protein LepA|uniref:Elongation factor 4 n=1 Tax=Halalkalibacterium halodurans (strain ATCC BAA-125 / DSM 18197 / FERM 7344 / JCM 9153 / C-125) TaxID=272558 RepID=LEPA_HALH5|nr:translation elongation factor 4 [Halalkalibacterium halodurans]Q9KD76.1 RecName: Full=Elongation factor 4; Short=EF-4; AltName: Full=Ribosomal back-translocase LepA [Halalkalibacterium halodurans C-125]MDY7221868.1 translation elongation factor 4 [Halalkalibacterium halodurans]MDY7241144.1 translation elongation factor 4 [Halalkalibacterium halodurans]MED4080576.1 translation elongation factor 4 [Halalkalibacterium halodurans]MED4083802.1 translation elongation factor 4 [Halalkalibacterium 